MLIAAGALAAITCDDARPTAPLADQIADAFCTHQFACCSPFEISEITSDRYQTQDECAAFATLAAGQQLGAVQGAIAQGRITVDAARLSACVAAYGAAACNTSMLAPEVLTPLPTAADFVASCPGLLIGHVPDNAACNVSAECQAGSRCVSGDTNPGVNGGYGGVGGSGASLAGNPGVCLPYQEQDQPCNSTADCDPAANLVCRTQDFRCGAPAQEGEPCMTTFDPFTGRTLNDCDAGKRLYCDNVVSNTCRHYPRDGEPCNQFVFPQCDPDPALALSCNPISGTCKKPGNEGDACGAPAIPPCRADLACHPTQADGIGQCGSLPRLGERCTDRCATPTACAGGLCIMPGTAKVGAPCATNADCASLSCNTFTMANTRLCSPALNSARCVGSSVTPSGNGGFGGTFMSGSGGSFFTGVGGSFAMVGSGGSFGGSVGTAGTAGVGGAGGAGGGPPLGCPFSAPAPGDPVIADFGVDGATSFPIGRTFVYPAGEPSSPVATVTGGAWHITVEAPGTMIAQYFGAGIVFDGAPTRIACVDGSFHSGVQFDISGTVDGMGCTAQFWMNDSEHTDSNFDPRGSGPVGSYAPQAPIDVTATPTTIAIPFEGADAPMGGNPAIPIDPFKLTGVQWQFTVALGTENSCSVDVTIDNVRFF